LRLLTKTNIYLLYFTILAFIASGFIFYYSIRTIVYKQIDSSLITEKDIIQEQIEHTDTIPDFNAAFGHLIEVKVFDKSMKNKQIIKDTLIDTENEVQDIPYRNLYFASNTKNHKGYTINISHPLSEKQELLENISTLLFVLFILLMFIFTIVNYWISKKLWIPFYKSLDIINRFEINSSKPLALSNSDIKEFNELNQVLVKMSEKIRNDYINLKEFNENASHEVQTPLSVIRTKLELLMQYENLNTDQVNLLESVNNSVSRLSKLNQGLLVISKIDNQQFTAKEEVIIEEVFKNILNEFEEIIQLKKINVSLDFESNIVIEMNPILAEILTSNLISNSVRHNTENGYINITTRNRTLIISNSGHTLKIDANLLFNRFTKGSAENDSVGLGLSIVKRIANYYNLSISYLYSNNVHEIRIDF
jgi:signal transduction histidine kinase